MDVEAGLLPRGGGAVDPDHRHLLHLLAVEGAVGDVEAGDGGRHVVVERDDADAEDLRGGPRRLRLRRGGIHGRRRGRRGGWAVVLFGGGVGSRAPAPAPSSAAVLLRPPALQPRPSRRHLPASTSQP